ncbi:MAG: bifunctional phosphopantothenoylcysteine decarboxylase/phosphopantothenate--cysteine ligase CoaBC [Candidatus Cloacimonetes bacterium]|nr:bifunctional phosphopantothenoylcysteine decarboxylase/phosphopantothenate--cysteine ligase CoaBC [Candidatus Cloacimonadota bacterium]
MLEKKNILLGITGGIAAYKALELASRLSKQGAIVKTIMTKNACEFVSPLSFKSITHQTVSTEMFDPTSDIEHISLADWADIVVIAPATANIIGKAASGIADDLLSTTIMATSAPVLFVPAMNVHMFENQIVQKNILKLEECGYFFMEPDSGKLACGYEGKGRFPDPSEIVYYVKTFLNYEKDLKDNSILITAGATRENIDPMRFITNYSSGKMGLALARASVIRGAKVMLVSANLTEQVPFYIDNISCRNADEMYREVIREFPKNRITIKTAAVSDYTPTNPSDQKIQKGDDLILELRRTIDILSEIGKLKTDDQILIGFAAESQDIKENALLKLQKKNLDFIVANDLNVAGKDQTSVFFLGKNCEEKIVGDKFFAAHKILDLILKHKAH